MRQIVQDEEFFGDGRDLFAAFPPHVGTSVEYHDQEMGITVTEYFAADGNYESAVFSFDVREDGDG